jgi:hypothetical protein
MGTILYGSPPAMIEVEDRLLAHLKIVIVQKLRRNESFLLSWSLEPDEGSGRVSVWMHASIPMQFRFAGSRPPQLNSAWLDEMGRASMSMDGLRIMPEPTESDASPTTGQIRLPILGRSSQPRSKMPTP